jgi:pimeloyl-ACP methyl ester carboxylesterase
MLSALFAVALSAAPGSYVQLKSGVKMYFEKHGENGSPILLLHGGTGSAHNWAKVIPAFAKGHVVYVPELQGHAHTADIDRPFTYDALTEDVADFLGQQKLEHVDIAGLSDGGIIALILSVKHPNLVRKVLATGANWSMNGSVDPAVLKWLTGARPDDWDKAFIAEWSDGNPDPAHWPIFFEKMKKMWVGLNRPIKELDQIKAPVMLMAGDQDLVKLDHTVEMHKHIKDSELAILPGTGHDTPMMRPEWFASIALDFFATPLPEPTPSPAAPAAASGNAPPKQQAQQPPAK